MPSRTATIVPISIPVPFRPGSVNAFRVELAEGGWMLVDGGVDTAEAWSALDRGVHASGGWDGLRLNLVTHMHIDHVGLAGRVHLQTGCPLVLGQLDAERMQGAARDPEGEAGYRRSMYRQAGIPSLIAEAAEEASAAGRKLAPPRMADRMIPTDNGEVDGAAEWRAIWTPGHTAGHISLFRQDDGALISGDAVLADISPTIGVNRQREDVVGDYLAALDRLAALPVRTIFPGHGEPFSDAERIGELRRILLRETGRVRGLLDAEPRSAWEIMRRRYPGRELPVPALLQAVRETLAHLVHLQRQAAATAEAGEDGVRLFSRGARRTR